jgi:hypothetical protein
MANNNDASERELKLAEYAMKYIRAITQDAVEAIERIGKTEQQPDKEPK